ncbi:MAG: tetratricopeptide repeat protein [Archangium sp.]
MRAKDTCPSCFQPISPGDFLCASCELILEPALATTRPVREVSVVRRMLEAPQRGVPSQVPTRPQIQAPGFGSEGPTRVMTLPPEVNGVPVVVATLSHKAAQLTELEAWVVSLIDGLSDAPALARKIGFKELELRVLLTVLQSKGVVDFADEPWSNADLNLPSVLGTLDESEDVPVVTGEFDAPMPPPPPMEEASQPTDQHYVPPRIAPARVPPAQPKRADVAPPYPGSSPSRVSTPYAGSSPSRSRAADDVSPPPYPGSSPSRHPAEVPVVSAPSNDFIVSPDDLSATPVPPPKAQSTDPRIQYSGQANRRVLDALKQVKRNENAASAAREEKEQSYADVMARDTLQVALRMEQNGRLDEAIRFLEKSIAQSPEAPSLYNRLGIILMRERRDFRRAEELIRKAVELAPENTVYATNLQQVLSRHALSAQR